MLESFLRDRFPFEARRAQVRSMATDSAIWTAFAQELFVLGTSSPENVGGFGGGPIENMIVMEELGKVLSVEPWLSTIIMAGALLRDGGPKAQETMSSVVQGTAIVVPAIDYFPESFSKDHFEVTVAAADRGYRLSGKVAMVRDARRATHFLVAATEAGEQALVIVDANAPGLVQTLYPLVDGIQCADISLTDVEVEEGAVVARGKEAADRIAEAFDAGVVGLCAEALGIQRMLLKWTVDYAKQRQQFGRPIGDFQVLQHRMATMLIKVEETASMTYLATAHLKNGSSGREKVVSAAKVAIDQAGLFVGQQAVQIHGGMGMSKELPIADCFSRLTVIAQQLGSTEYHFGRYEAHSFAKKE
jgi:alkylation response protein AidB-like acyl-CoA dehydrogenase